jgi:hypothetical protein
MAVKTITRRQLPVRVALAPSGAQCLVITMKAVQCMEERYQAEHVPTYITWLWMGCDWKVMKQALLTGYVKFVSRPRGLSDCVRKKILEIRGEASRWIYAG